MKRLLEMRKRIRVFEHAVEDLAEFSSLPMEEAKARLMSSFKSFMNDQCAVNGVLTKKIEELRKEVLPTVLDINTLSPGDLEKVEKMGHFACRMHLLANFATAADKGILAYEEAVCSGQNPHSYTSEDQSGTLRLIRSTAKALTKRGCDKSGVNAYFESFLQAEGQSNHIVTFVGHRFNIMFVDAAAIYFHKEDITAFMRLMPDPNRLLRSVAWDIDQKVYVAALRALGLISKSVMEPFYKLLIGGNSIMDITNDLALLHSRLDEWSKDGSGLLCAPQIFSSKYYPQEDALLDALLQDTGDCEMDSLTQVATELICGELLLLFERQAASQLPGGEYAAPSDYIKASSKNVPAHNQLSERDMASYDNLVKTKPSASMTAIEATIMWQNNKTGQWLDGLSEENRTQVFKSARQKKADYIRKVKERLDRLKEEKLERLRKKQQRKHAQEDTAIESRLKCIRDVKEFGGMWEATEVDSKLDELADDQLKRALLAQIKYHKVVVKAKGPRQLFQASSEGHYFSTKELVTHLKEILQLQATPSAEPTQQGLQMLPDYQTFTSERKDAIAERLVEARRKRLNLQQVENILPSLLENTSAIVGKIFFHKCREDGEVHWFRGRVVSVKRRMKDPERTEYNVTYDVTPNDTWHFPLLLDLRKGDLVFES